MRDGKGQNWVVVCDGKKALYFENDGRADAPHLSTRLTEEHDDAPTRDINSDAPGRAFNSVGNGRSAMDDGDAHELAEERFLKSVAMQIEKLAEDKDFAEFTLVAPPRALGILRREFSPQLKKKLHAEIEKDLVKFPVPEIERHLARELGNSV